MNDTRFKQFKGISILILCFIMCFYCCNNAEYPKGRDTVKSFGSGRFQILRIKGEPNFLYDVKLQNTVIEDVLGWQKKSNIVFVLGNKSLPHDYVALHVKTENVEKYTTYESIPTEYRKPFKDLIEKELTKVGS